MLRVVGTLQYLSLIAPSGDDGDGRIYAVAEAESRKRLAWTGGAGPSFSSQS